MLLSKTVFATSGTQSGNHVSHNWCPNKTWTNSGHQLATLPDRLHYSTVRIESPTGRVLYLPRRDLYDIRVQLLQEGSHNDEVIDQLDKSDLRSGIYEGGFKTWECALDLASLLLDRGPRKDIDDLIRCDQVIEASHYLVLSCN